ncbi:MAG: ROK family protein [Pseudomonadota bacterium]
MPVWLGGVEAGGSKFRCAVAQYVPGRDAASLTRVKPLAEISIPTTDPSSTLARVREFFAAQPGLSALGVASFGPLCVNPQDAAYGTLLDTPKLAWQGVDLRAGLAISGMPIVLHTDVVAAALAEFQVAGEPAPPVMVYVTVGTGIGAAVLVNGKPLPGPGHAEFGHLYVQRHPVDDGFAGSCPYHGDCLEGLASAPALAARCGVSQAAVATIQDEQVWQIEAEYLAQACVNLLRTLAPARIVLGGGVMQRAGLLAQVLAHTRELLGGYYAPAPDGLANCIVPPTLGDGAGLRGALVLAAEGLAGESLAAEGGLAAEWPSA